MRCPSCGPDDRTEYDLNELFEHMLDRHPGDLLEIAKTIVADVVLEETEIRVVQEAPARGA